MPITTTSTFTELSLNRISATEDVQVNWKSPDDNGSVLKALSDPDNADLAVLQEIYASADGFGSSAVGVFNYPPQVTSFADIELHGFPNPLIAGFYDRHIAKGEAVAVFGLESAEVTEDSVSGRHDIKLKGGLLAKRRRPSTGQMKLDLRDLSMRPDLSRPDVRAWIVYEAPIGAYYPSASPGKLAPMRALLSWLESIRTSDDVDAEYSGGPVNLTPTSGAELFAAMTNRKYTLNFHGLLYDFVIDSTTQYTNQQTVEFRTDTVDGITATLDLNEFFSAMMNADEQTITVDAEVEYPPNSLRDAPNYGSSFRFDDDLILRHKNLYPTILAKDAAGDWYETPLGYGRVVALQSLPTFNLKQRLGAFYGVGAIHMDATYTSDETLILPDPSTFLQLWGTAWVLTLHNQNATYNFHVEDADEELIVTLLPGEIRSLHFSYNHLGKEEITNAGQFSRSLIYDHTPTNGKQVTDADYMVYDSDTYIRLIPLDQIPDLVNAEAFNLNGTATYSEGDDINDLSDYHIEEHSAKLSQAGKLRIDVEVGVRTGSGSGNIGNDHGLVVLRQRQQLDPTVLRRQYQRQMGQNENESWFTGKTIPVAVNDIILFGFVYPINSTFNIDNVRYSSVGVEMDLERTVRVTP